MKNFKIGDRVVAKVPVGCKDAEDQHGTVIGFNSVDISVEFDKDIGEHTCSEQTEGRDAKDGYGWFVLPRNLKPETSRFKVGQIYRSNCDDAEKGNIVRIKKISGKWIKYDTIRGEKLATGFAEGSPFAEGLVLLTGKEIGKAIRKWDAEHGKVREVKRHANVGEYIKVLSTDSCDTGRFKVGDILKVTKEPGSPWNGKAVCFNGTINVIEDKQYVVLEGYKPEKEEHRKAKVGDTIKVLRDNGGAVRAGTIWKVTNSSPLGSLYVTNEDWGGGFSVNSDNYVVISFGKHSYTEEQIDEAKKLCRKMMAEAFDDKNTFSLSLLDKNYDKSSSAVNCEISRLRGANGSKGTAKCSDHDEYNVWIGRCVALCKALHKPIPAFIMEG